MAIVQRAARGLGALFLASLLLSSGAQAQPSPGSGAALFAATAISNNTALNFAGGVPLTLYSVQITNTTSATCYLQMFNSVAALVTVGTTAPSSVTAIPATSSAAVAIPPTVGVRYGSGASFVATTTATGSTACGATVYVEAYYR